MAALASDLLRRFRLFLWNRWTEFNETWQEARSQRPLPSLCFSGRSEKQDGRPGLWLAETFSPLLWNYWTELNETWQEARSQRLLQSLCFSGRSEKQDGRPGLWLAETFLASSLKQLNGIERNLTGSKISTSSTKFVFFGPIGKTRWPPWPLICWHIYDFFSTNFYWWVNKNCRPGRSVKKVAHCTHVHDMWPFGPLVFILYIDAEWHRAKDTIHSGVTVLPYYHTMYMYLSLTILHLCMGIFIIIVVAIQHAYIFSVQLNQLYYYLYYLCHEPTGVSVLSSLLTLAFLHERGHLGLDAKFL